jgi:hypothetical protein
MPWQHSPYHRYYYFRRRRMVWLALLIPLTIWLLWLVTGKYLADPSYAPVWETPRCRGKNCLYSLIGYVLLFLFLLLPVWIKLPSIAIATGELFSRVLALLYWSIDSRPDFAIGPHGIYGLYNFKYQHFSWSKIGPITHVETNHKFGKFRTLIFETKHTQRQFSLFDQNKTKRVKIVIAPIHGINIDEVLTDIAAFAPNKKVRHEVFD